jgi:hypothetical protein
MTADTTEPRRARRVTIRVLAVLGLLTFNFMFVFVVGDAMGRVDQDHELAPAGSPEAQFGADHPGESVHIVGAAAAVAIGATGLIGLIIRPDRAGSATQTGAAAIAMLITTGIVGDPDNYGGQGLLIDPAFLVLALPPLAAAVAAAPWRAWRRRALARPRLAVLALFALPWVWYGIEQGMMQRNTWPPMADPHHQAHWYAASVLAFLIVLVVAGASLHGRGWRLAATTAGSAAAAIAVVSVADPSSASALPAGWATPGIAWGLAVLATTWLEPGQTTGPPKDAPDALDSSGRWPGGRLQRN